MLRLSANNLGENGKGFTERLFTALASPQVADVFERHVGEFLEISAALKSSMAYFCEGLSKEGVAGLFERHPKAFLAKQESWGEKARMR